jgi:hypothetical protein
MTKTKKTRAKQKTYTLIGFYPDTKQRWASFCEAKNPNEAERMMAEEYPCAVICGVIEGNHKCVDTNPYIE